MLLNSVLKTNKQTKKQKNKKTNKKQTNKQTNKQKNTHTNWKIYMIQTIRGIDSDRSCKPLPMMALIASAG